MTRVDYENVDLRVIQQGNEIHEEGIQSMRGLLSINHDNGIASFVEDCAKVRSSKNPLWWKGKHVSLRIDKEGKLRGTFRIDIPQNEDALSQLVTRLDVDFGGVIARVSTLAKAKSPEKVTKKSKKSNKHVA